MRLSVKPHTISPNMPKESPKPLEDQLYKEYYIKGIKLWAIIIGALGSAIIICGGLLYNLFNSNSHLRQKDLHNFPLGKPTL